MNPQAQIAMRRRCAINRLMQADESFSCRLNRVINFFPVSAKLWS